ILDAGRSSRVGTLRLNDVRSGRWADAVRYWNQGHHNMRFVQPNVKDVEIQGLVVANPQAVDFLRWRLGEHKSPDVSLGRANQQVVSAGMMGAINVECLLVPVEGQTVLHSTRNIIRCDHIWGIR